MEDRPANRFWRIRVTLLDLDELCLSFLQSPDELFEGSVVRFPYDIGIEGNYDEFGIGIVHGTPCNLKTAGLLLGPTV